MSYGNYNGGRNYGEAREARSPRSDYAGNRDRNSSRHQQWAPREEVAPPVVEEVKEPIDPTSRDLILFKDRFYAVELLRKQAGPEIQVKVEELAADIENAAKESRPMSEEIQNLKPVFAKYEGHYVVLLGLKTVLAQLRTDGHNAVIKGRLLSNPVLKRCVVS